MTVVVAPDRDVVETGPAAQGPLVGGGHEQVALWAGSRKVTSKPAATVCTPRELQASANALSASAATSPPWQTS